MKKSFIALLHTGFWTCYFILIVIMLAVYYRSSLHAPNQEARIVNALKSLLLFAFIPSVISYWIYYFWLFPRYLQHKRVFLSIIHGAVISLVGAVVGYILIRFSIESGYMIDMDDAGKHGRSTSLHCNYCDDSYRDRIGHSGIGYKRIC